MTKNKNCKVILPAAGHGTRMGMDIDKQYIQLSGVPILVHTARHFEKNKHISEIFIGTDKKNISLVEDLIKKYELSKSKVIVGGETRQATIYNALCALPEDTDIVLVHDGVRPFITQKNINDLIAVASDKKSAVLGVPAKDTIKKIAADFTVTTLDRSMLWVAHTPQVFDYHLLMEANKYALSQSISVTDDASLVEAYTEGEVYFVEGSSHNIKITTPDDLAYAEFLMGLPAFKPLPAPVSQASDSITAENKTVTIYTDGACSGNPGPGGYGAVLLYNGKRKEISKGFKATTNNRMELTAIIDALALLKNKATVELYSDSKYVVDAINLKWVYKWEANNWKRNKTEMAQNIDLWEALLPLLKKHDVTFKWVKGHANNVENERCDALARAAVADVR